MGDIEGAAGRDGTNETQSDGGAEGPSGANRSRPTNPRVFISYSHDSADHKQWVAELATFLRHHGIDAILDQWDLPLGADITLFMEDGIKTSDRVLLICTESYVRKAEAGEGGVGYERMIVTANLVRNIDTTKFVPIIRQSAGKHDVPAFLATRLYLDMSQDEDTSVTRNTLVNDLKAAPHTPKPPLGDGRAIPANATGFQPLIHGLDESLDPGSVYSKAVTFAQVDDIVGWRQLLKRIRQPIHSGLLSWRQKHDARPPESQESLQLAVSEGIEIAAPLFAIALAGVESTNPHFCDQRAVVDELLQIPDWNRQGRVVLLELPSVLVYVYHNLHGGIALSTNRLDLALSLARTTISPRYSEGAKELWQRHDLTGWSESLGRNCREAWAFLFQAVKQWPWIGEVFGGEDAYRVSLIAYNMVLNAWELVDLLAKGNESILNAKGALQLDVPMCFARESRDLESRAGARVGRQLAALGAIAETRGVTTEMLRAAWPKWMAKCVHWLNSDFDRDLFLEDFPHGRLFTERSGT